MAPKCALSLRFPPAPTPCFPRYCLVSLVTLVAVSYPLYGPFPSGYAHLADWVTGDLDAGASGSLATHCGTLVWGLSWWVMAWCTRPWGYGMVHALGYGMTHPTLTDSVVRTHTAFTTASELRSAIQGGYVPTVSQRRQAALLIALHEEGLPVFVVR